MELKQAGVLIFANKVMLMVKGMGQQSPMKTDY